MPKVITKNSGTCCSIQTHRPSMSQLHKAYKGEENGRTSTFLHEGGEFSTIKKIQMARHHLYPDNPSSFVAVFQEIWEMLLWMNRASCNSPLSPSLPCHLVSTCGFLVWMWSSIGASYPLRKRRVVVLAVPSLPLAAVALRTAEKASKEI